MNDNERANWLSLPNRFGGMGIIRPFLFSQSQYQDSISISKPLADSLLGDSDSVNTDSFDLQDAMLKIRKNCSRVRNTCNQVIADIVKTNLPNDRQRLFDLANERGASVWLSALPLKEFSFDLHKGAFRDAICLRYGWRRKDLPSSCVCGNPTTIDHSLSCPYGGFPTLRHSALCDLSANLLKEVCHNINREPPLQPLSGESFELLSTTTADGARLDIAADGFWGYSDQRVLFDVKVVNPLSQTYANMSLPACYQRAEQLKKRIREVEHGTFSPIIFATTGGVGPVASSFLKRLGLLISEKSQLPYRSTLNLLRCELSFSIIKSSIRCIRGSRSSSSRPITTFPNDFDREISESLIN